MSKTLLMPAEGRLVRDPRSREPLPASGAEIDLQGADATYWARRIAEGDVLAHVEPAAPIEVPSKTVQARNRSTA